MTAMSQLEYNEARNVEPWLVVKYIGTEYIKQKCKTH